MRIAGFEKDSLVDYPGKLAAVIFTPGCNMNCHYCHNRQLLAPGEQDDARIDSAEVLGFLRSRAGWLEGVVISGGEPTLQPGLADFLAEIKALGYAVKLDTNGTRPWVIEDLLDRGLVDFVAMDVKAPARRYAEVAGADVDLAAVGRSIELLLTRAPDYEFRTTFAPELSAADIAAIGLWIRGARRYVLQQYRPVGRSVDLFGVVESPRPRDSQYIRRSAKLAGRFVESVATRGLSGADLSIGSYVPTVSAEVQPGGKDPARLVPVPANGS